MELSGLRDSLLRLSLVTWTIPWTRQLEGRGLTNKKLRVFMGMVIKLTTADHR
uniref:Uncharacterized protein n=1 Tax=Picea sitchensis TaxID=3332 RepID=A0A6B9XWL9_PICSI|nr:hypothetical protein Q903MT_gene5788 [Picea sitchensis]